MRYEIKGEPTPVVICESRGTQAEDALALRRMYQAAKNGEK